jgi:hypothetical protein
VAVAGAGLAELDDDAGDEPGSAAMARVARKPAARSETWEVFIGIAADGLWFAMFSVEIKPSNVPANPTGPPVLINRTFCHE